MADLSATQGFGGVGEDRDDVGSNRYTGFRLSTRWQPSEYLDLTLSYLQQEIEQDGATEVDLDLAGHNQQRRYNTGLAGSSYELNNNDIDIANFVVNYDLGWGAVTSSSSWLKYENKTEEDKVYLINLFNRFIPSIAASQPYALDGKTETDKIIQEIRFASQFEGAIQVSTGLYYEDKDRSTDVRNAWSGGVSMAPSGVLQSFEDSEKTKQKAFFGEVSYNITDQWSLSLGGRFFDYDVETVTQTSFRGTLRPESYTAVNETGKIYKGVISYTPNEDILVYAQWSEGFRLGKDLPDTNVSCDSQGIPTPDQLDSDTSENFELGIKTSLADNRITLNATVYSIDWKGIPVVTSHPNNCFVTENAGKAKSEGVEIEFQGRLTENLQLDISASYGEATLVGDSSIGNDGDNLPGSADFNASAGVEYGFFMAGYESFARIDYSYISEYYNSVNEDELGSLPAGGFGQFNLKSGIQFGQVGLDLFINNLTNEDGLTWVETIAASGGGGDRAYRIRPRTIGLNISYQF